MSSSKSNRQEMIQKAMELFWEKGFHATSMRNLQQVMDIRPGSIYASFNSKEGLFIEALRYYTKTGLERIAKYSDNDQSPLSALKAFVRDIVLEQSNGAPSVLCMLLKTISELTIANDNLLIESKKLLSAFENAFTDLFVLAQASNELDGTKDPKRHARYLQMQLMGLRFYACTNDNKETLNELVDDMFIGLI